MFGMFSDSEKNSTCLCGANMKHCEHNNYNKINKIVRGGKVSSGHG